MMSQEKQDTKKTKENHNDIFEHPSTIFILKSELHTTPFLTMCHKILKTAQKFDNIYMYEPYYTGTLNFTHKGTVSNMMFKIPNYDTYLKNKKYLVIFNKLRCHMLPKHELQYYNHLMMHYTRSKNISVIVSHEYGDEPIPRYIIRTTKLFAYCRIPNVQELSRLMQLKICDFELLPPEYIADIYKKIALMIINDDTALLGMPDGVLTLKTL